MALTATQKVDIRRFIGYPAMGSVNNNAFGYYFWQGYSQLEWRMDHLSPEDEAVVISNYLVRLTALETAAYDTTENLDTAKAAVWTHNPLELQQRTQQFNYWRRKLAQFFGVPVGPELKESNNIRLVN